MKFTRKSKKIIILAAMAIFLLVLILIFSAFAKSFFYSNAELANYGSRLDGIKEVKIDNKKVDSVKNEISSNEKVNKVKYVLEGRIVNFIIDVKKGMNVDDAKKLSDIVITLLDDEQKKYYDTQIYVTCNEAKDDESKDFPIIGYRHKTSTKFVWTK